MNMGKIKKALIVAGVLVLVFFVAIVSLAVYLAMPGAIDLKELEAEKAGKYAGLSEWQTMVAKDAMSSCENQARLHGVGEAGIAERLQVCEEKETRQINGFIERNERQ